MMRFLSKLGSMQIELIAPEQRPDVLPFTEVVDDPWSRRRRLDELQRFRGGVYVNEGFLRPQDLDSQGRHDSPADALRWHLLVTDQSHAIKACASICFHIDLPTVEELTVYEMLARSTGDRLSAYTSAIQRLLRRAEREELRFGEAGGWAVSTDARNSAVAVTTILASWALARLCSVGESMWVAGVGKGKRAEKILSRMGGFPLTDPVKPLPSFFDPGYNSQIDILGFDTRVPCPGAIEAIDELCHRLQRCRVFARRRSYESVPVSIMARRKDTRAVGPNVG